MEEEFKRLESGGLQKWEEHLEILTKRSRKHSTEIGDQVSNSHLNRYLNVRPYDKSRVRLSRANDTDYINANLVTVPKAARQYILTQGPLQESLGHFWLMVWEQKSNVIVMLNKIVEMEDYIKCEQYWPNKLHATDNYDELNLSVTLKSVKPYKHFTVRELELEDKLTDKSRLILQFHYTAWPDHGEPDSPTSFLRLLTAIRKSGGLDKMDEPTIVHCSAGIGRSGTFCLIDSILSMVENQGSIEGIDIDNTLLEMRDYRMGLIQSSVQLKFAHMCIIYGIKILENANKLHPHISSIKDNMTQHVKDNNVASQESANKLSNGNSTVATQNGGTKTKPSRRRNNKKSTSNPGSLNVFKKHLLVEALDDIDSDEADSLFYDTMKPWPHMKKPRNSSPEEDDDINEDHLKQIEDLIKNGSIGLSSSSSTNNNPDTTSTTTKAQKFDKAINSMLTENMISTTTPSLTSNANSTNVTSSTTNTDSVLLRRREKELRNQRVAEKTMEILDRMKVAEKKREDYTRNKALFKRITFGIVVLIASTVIYNYFSEQ